MQSDLLANRFRDSLKHPFACRRGLDDFQDWEVLSEVDAISVASTERSSSAEEQPEAQAVRAPAGKPSSRNKAGAEIVKKTAKELRDAANEAAQEAALERKEAKLKQLRDRYDIVLPHGASMKEIDRVLKIQQRQKVKKEVFHDRENQKMKKQADIRGNRQRSKSWDMGLDE